MIDNAIYFFRERIEEAFRATTYAPTDTPRTQKGSNDTIYRKLAGQFTTEEAYGATVSVRGLDVQRGRVFTMLSRWERQGMVERLKKGVYKKIVSSRNGVSLSLQPYTLHLTPYVFTFPLPFRASQSEDSRKTVGKSSRQNKTSKKQTKKMIKNMSIILSEHFNLTEFTTSLVASTRRIDNTPPLSAVSNRQQVIGHLVKR